MDGKESGIVWFVARFVEECRDYFEKVRSGEKATPPRHDGVNPIHHGGSRYRIRASLNKQPPALLMFVSRAEKSTAAPVRLVFDGQDRITGPAAADEITSEILAAIEKLEAG